MLPSEPRHYTAFQARTLVVHRPASQPIEERGGASPPRIRLQGSLSAVDDNQQVVGALSVVGPTKMSNFSQSFAIFFSKFCKFQLISAEVESSGFPAIIWNFLEIPANSMKISAKINRFQRNFSKIYNITWK